MSIRLNLPEHEAAQKISQLVIASRRLVLGRCAVLSMRAEYRGDDISA